MPLCRERTVVGLGEELVRRGSIGDAWLERLAGQVADFAALARAMGAEQVEVVLSAPGRDASNAAVLTASVGHAAAARATTLSIEELAAAAFDGALIGNPVTSDPVAVCDVGATTTVVAIGTREGGPAYVRAVDFGSLSACEQLGREQPCTRR